MSAERAASVFDRLLDDAPDRATDEPRRPAERVRMGKEALRRDLESLFNTPASIEPAMRGREEIETSLLRYGVVGFQGLDLATVERRHALARQLRDVIVLHEPRLRDVRVEVGGDHAEARSLRLRVVATASFDEVDEPIAFDTVLDPAVRQFRVERGST